MIRSLALAALLGAAPAAAAVLNAAVQRSTGPVDAGNETAGSVDPAARADYELEARRQLEQLRGQLDEAEKKASELSAQAHHEANERLTDLHKQADKAQKQVSELERSGQQRWNVVRRHLDSTLDDLRREYQSLSKDLENEPKPSTP